MEQLLKDALNLLPEYLTFLISFVARPAAEMRRYASQDKIDKKLVAFLGVALALSWVIVFVASNFIPHEYRGFSLDVLRRAFPGVVHLISKPKLIPLLAVVSITFLLAALHLIMATWNWLLNLGPEPDRDFSLGGSVWDTINAGLGFAALFVPLLAAYGAVTTVLMFIPNAKDVAIGLVGLVVLLASVFYYLPGALSGTHRATSFRQAFFATVFGLACLAWAARAISRT